MNFNLVSHVKSCVDYVSSNPPELGLVYYSHIPTAIVSLLFTFFVFIKNKRALISKILLGIAVTFSLWLSLDLVTWINPDSRKIFFSWSVLGALTPLFYILCLYFIYVFIDKKDVSLKIKIFWGLLYLPVLLMTPTSLNLTSFDATNCLAINNNNFLYYSYFIEIIIPLWILFIAAIRFRRADKFFRKQILLITTGIVLFLFSFFLSGSLGDYLVEHGMVLGYKYELYGLFGMTIFLGFLGYLIVRYKAFDIKLIATQALVIVLTVLVGSQYFFIQSSISRALNGVALALVLAVGYILVKSVKLEVQRKEELQLLSDKLAMANSKLRELDKAKSEFISIASHQLRTPLTSIKGFGSLLLEGTYGELPAAQRAALEKVYISNERLIQLVEDLLNISRMEAGRMEFDFQEAQIEDLVQEAVNTLELSAKQKNLYLHWQKPAFAFPKVKIDITKVKEVISNMIDNAIKYTQKGGVTVRVEKGNFFDHDAREQKSVMRVIVSDTGIGMEKDEIEAIFEKFTRGRQVSHYRTEGTGLGMYVGKKVVEAHKGKIFAESDGKGKGSRFTLELPFS